MINVCDEIQEEMHNVKSDLIKLDVRAGQYAIVDEVQKCKMSLQRDIKELGNAVILIESKIYGELKQINWCMDNLTLKLQTSN